MKTLGKNLVIQGVAGSGKTTVALHRIAYLVYNYRNVYKPSDYMVIGPNSFFVSYISSILPDLDVNGVAQNTINELVLNYVNEKFIIDNSLDIIKENDGIASYKVSMNMKKDIDEYFQSLKIIPDSDFTIDNVKILDNSLIKKIYNDINKNTFVSVKSRIDRMILLQEDSFPFGIQAIDQEEICNKMEEYDIVDKVQFYNGTDEGAGVLLGRIIVDEYQMTPKVYLHMPNKMRKTLDKCHLFEDRPFSENLYKMFNTIGLEETKNIDDASFVLALYAEEENTDLILDKYIEVPVNKDDDYNDFINKLRMNN